MLVANSAAGQKDPTSDLILVIEEFGAYRSARHNFISIYADGTAIFLKQTDQEEGHYQSAHVSSVPELMEEWGASVLPKNSTRYELTNRLHQPATRIWYRGKCINIYGDWRITPTAGGVEDTTATQELELARSLPEQVRNFCKHIDSFNPTNSSVWYPDAIRITLEKTDYAHGENPVLWPADLPNPKTAEIIREEYGLFSFDISYRYMERVNELHNEMGRGRALVIDGARHNIWLRWVIPGRDILEQDHKAAFGNTYP